MVSKYYYEISSTQVATINQKTHHSQNLRHVLVSKLVVEYLNYVLYALINIRYFQYKYLASICLEAKVVNERYLVLGMVRPPRNDKPEIKKGAWSREEDKKLMAYISKYGIWNWSQMPKFAGNNLFILVS